MRNQVVIFCSALLFLSMSQSAAAKIEKKDCSIPNEVEYDLKVDRSDISYAEPEDAVDGGDLNFTIPFGTCGKPSNLLSTYQSSRLDVTLSGKKFSFAPIMLSDKHKGQYNCYAVKVRNACVGVVRKADDGFSVELKADKSAQATSATVQVLKSGQIIYPPGNSQFFLAPFLQGGKNPGPFSEKVKNAFSKYACSGRRNCDYERLYLLEWSFLDRLRSLRALGVPSNEARDDTDYFLKAVGSLSGAKRVIHEFIVENEINIGKDSPYALGDAVNANSGPSFGAHQIDIAANSSDDVAVFRSIVRDTYKNSKDATAAKLIHSVNAQVYELPIREYQTKLLANLYSDWPIINSALRSELGKIRYDDRYFRYLDSQVAVFEALKKNNPFIQKYPWAGFYLIDIANQYGGYNSFLPQFRSAAATASDENDFKARVQAIMLSGKYGRNYPDDVKRRMKNVLETVNKYYAPGAVAVQ